MEKLIKWRGLYVPLGFALMPKEARKELFNGCGPAGWKYDIIPDNILGVFIGDCCDCHDYGYEFGTTKEEKDFSDMLLLRNMIRRVNRKSANFFTRFIRRTIALRYYDAVYEAGKSSFNAGD